MQLTMVLSHHDTPTPEPSLTEPHRTATRRRTRPVLRPPQCGADASASEDDQRQPEGGIRMTLRRHRMLGLGQSAQLRQLNALWVVRAREARQESRQLRQHARALRAHYQYLRQHYLLVECTWCQKHLSWQYMDKPFVLPIVDGLPTSHGVCPTCFETQVQALRRRKP